LWRQLEGVTDVSGTCHMCPERFGPHLPGHNNRGVRKRSASRQQRVRFRGNCGSWPNCWCRLGGEGTGRRAPQVAAPEEGPRGAITEGRRDKDVLDIAHQRRDTIDHVRSSRIVGRSLGTTWNGVHGPDPQSHGVVVSDLRRVAFRPGQLCGRHRCRVGKRIGGRRSALRDPPNEHLDRYPGGLKPLGAKQSAGA
jgi:hypothetical protein